ncbi:TetR/AcrR family transcriptional regulator [Bremerella sp. T1]|uniref:TetR/AcrR family transcriptional regulator n=1 Tax=Bremerella sp. TYQ1 TaxID=3119568 RepID=UPI001CCFF802|nr:TetR/AcrR family transcriptional regulator [Bremerella volcania]UBM35765.1 TetR/AcrR family transcriptional regulator [Bremerella volcania]
MGNETKSEIIEAGRKAMIAKSYNGVGLNEILTEAGVPKGSFYHFFKSKEELGVAVIESSVTENTEKLREALTDAKLSPLKRLEEYFIWARDDINSRELRQECLICKLALELSSLSEPLRDAVRHGWDEWRLIMTECLREAQAAGEIASEHDPESLAEFIIYSFEGAMIRVQVDNHIRPVNQFLHFVFQVLLKRS